MFSCGAMARRWRGSSASEAGSGHSTDRRRDHAHSAWRPGSVPSPQPLVDQRAVIPRTATWIGPETRADLVLHSVTVDGHRPIVQVAREHFAPFEAVIQ